jgi:tyrosinase
VSTAPTYTRREIRSLPPADATIPAYANAIALMKQRPGSDPTSWSYQAAIHGTHAPSPLPSWNQCHHGTWFFLAWHRMFIYHFEQILRAAVIAAGGAADWALPYWDYGLEGENATLPEPFRNPTAGGQANPLYVAERAPGINTGSTIPKEIVSPAFALSRPSFTGATEFGGGITSAGGQFWSQTGRLEQTPHNDIHNAIGGENGWMADPDQAAQDPIFWVHHANIDRIWALWNAAGHENPTDPRFLNQTFSFFDADGQPVSMSASQVLDTLTGLGYTYDQPPAAPAAAPAPGEAPLTAAVRRPIVEGAVDPPTPPNAEMVGASEAPLQLTGATAETTVTIDAQARDAALATPAAGAPGPRVYLNVEDIEAERNPGSVYGVYVNLPDQATPAQQAAHHAGNVSFFGVERARNPRGDEPAHGLRVAMDITELVHHLQADGEWDGQHVEVTFRPLGLRGPDTTEEQAALATAPPGTSPPATIGRVSIFFG